MTARGYETIARSHLIPALGRHRLDRLTTRHVQRLLDDLNASGRAPGTIQNVRAALNSALELRVKWQLVSRNVAANAEVPRITRRSIEPLSLAEAHRFLRPSPIIAWGHCSLSRRRWASDSRRRSRCAGRHRSRREPPARAAAHVPRRWRVAHRTHQDRPRANDPLPCRGRGRAAPATGVSGHGAAIELGGMSGRGSRSRRAPRLPEHHRRAALRPLRHPHHAEADA